MRSARLQSHGQRLDPLDLACGRGAPTSEAPNERVAGRQPLPYAAGTVLPVTTGTTESRLIVFRGPSARSKSTVVAELRNRQGRASARFVNVLQTRPAMSTS